MSSMPPHNKDGIIVGMAQIDKQPRYVVGYADMPNLRISVKPRNILNWVSQRNYGNWKQRLRDEIPREDALAKVGASDRRRSMEDKMLAGREEGNFGRKRKRSLAVEKVVNMTTMASSSVPGGNSTQVEREAVFASHKPPTLPTPSKQRGYDLDSEIDEEGDNLATDAALDHQLNGSLINPSQLNLKHSQSTTTSLALEKPPKTENPILTGLARQTRKSSTSASASATAINEAKRRQTYSRNATSSTKFAVDTNGSRVRMRSRPSQTRIPRGAHTKPLQTTSQRIPSTSSKQKRSATLPAPADEEDDEPQYGVVEILAEEFREGKKGKTHLYYLLRWEGDWVNSWEPEENVGSGVITEYKQKKHRETRMLDLDTVALRGINNDLTDVDINTDSRCKGTRDDLFDGESDEDSLFVCQWVAPEMLREGESG